MLLQTRSHPRTLCAVARTPAQRGTFGRWLTEARTARYATQAEAIEAMRRLAGIALHASEYAQWESGSRVPRPDNPKVARLYEFFGSEPQEPLQATETPGNFAAVVEAIDRQTAAIVAAIGARDTVLEGLLSELGRFRASQLEVLRSLGGPQVSMPEGESEREPHGPAPMQAAQ